MYGEEDGKPVKLFLKMIFESTPDYDVSSLPGRFPKEIKASVYSEQETNKTGFFESVWGSHYRSIYSTKITAKVATLDTLYGGLEIVRPGGGHQTKTLRLKTKGHKLEARLYFFTDKIRIQSHRALNSLNAFGLPYNNFFSHFF